MLSSDAPSSQRTPGSGTGGDRGSNEQLLKAVGAVATDAIALSSNTRCWITTVAQVNAMQVGVSAVFALEPGGEECIQFRDINRIGGLIGPQVIVDRVLLL